MIDGTYSAFFGSIVHDNSSLQNLVANWVTLLEIEIPHTNSDEGRPITSHHYFLWLGKSANLMSWRHRRRGDLTSLFRPESARPVQSTTATSTFCKTKLHSTERNISREYKRSKTETVSLFQLLMRIHVPINFANHSA